MVDNIPATIHDVASPAERDQEKTEKGTHCGGGSSQEVSGGGDLDVECSFNSLGVGKEGSKKERKGRRQ